MKYFEGVAVVDPARFLPVVLQFGSLKIVLCKFLEYSNILTYIFLKDENKKP